MAAPAVIPKALFVGDATAAGATILSSLTTTGYRITAIHVTNVDASPHTFSLWSSIGPMNMTDDQVLYKDVALAAGATKALLVPRVVGDPFNVGIGRLAIQADADSVLNVVVFGAEIDAAHVDVGRSLPVQSFQGFLKTNAALSPIFGVATANISGTLMSLTLCNFDASPHTVQLRVSFDGGATFKDLYTAIPVPANDTVELQDVIIIGVAAGTGLEGLFAGADVDDVITATASMVYTNVA